MIDPKNRNPLSLTLLLACAVLIPIDQVSAEVHQWHISQVYSNGNGSVQFIELRVCCNNENVTQGVEIITHQDGGQNQQRFTIPENLPAQTAGRHLLLATGPIDGVEPDFVIPEHFVPFNFESNGTVDISAWAWAGNPNRVDYSFLPTDGFRSINGHGQIQDPATATNFSGNSATLTPPPPEPLPSRLPPVWTQLSDPPAGAGRHDDIYFLNETVGYASRGSGHIYKTIDSGQTWTVLLEGTGAHFRAVGFVDEMRGWAGNLGPDSFNSNTTDTVPLYETSDGGETWSPVPGIEESGMLGLCALFVLDENHVFGGGRVRGPAYFIKTSDAGENWEIRNLTEMGAMNAIMDVYFTDPMNGFVVGMDTNEFAAGCEEDYFGQIARTTDGGETWEIVHTTEITCSYFWKISFPTPDVGYASLQQNGAHDSVVYIKTTDGGATWVEHQIPLADVIGEGLGFFIQGIGFVNENEGWIGGNGNAEPNNILHTTDGGETWTATGYDDSRQMNRFRFMTPELGFSAGRGLHVYKSLLAIQTHPIDQQVVSGETVTLSVEVDGNGPFQFQWFKNGVEIDGATSATLLVEGSARTNSGIYSVEVNSEAGAVLSSEAVVEVLVPLRLSPPEITDGTLRLTLTFADNHPMTETERERFRVETSIDLREWTPLDEEFTVQNEVLVLEKTATPSPRRFYRVVEP